MVSRPALQHSLILLVSGENFVGNVKPSCRTIRNYWCNHSAPDCDQMAPVTPSASPMIWAFWREKPVFGSLRTTKAKISLQIRAV